jgi:hypothetical protein
MRILKLSRSGWHGHWQMWRPFFLGLILGQAIFGWPDNLRANSPAFQHLNVGWKLARMADVVHNGSQVSRLDFDASSWVSAIVSQQHVLPLALSAPLVFPAGNLYSDMHATLVCANYTATPSFIFRGSRAAVGSALRI